jgi:hypothetical protein
MDQDGEYSGINPVNRSFTVYRICWLRRISLREINHVVH